MPLEKLIAGFRIFKSSYFDETDHYRELLKKGQTPQALVIACSDSRNDPALLTRSEPGDIFVVRNVASIVPPYEPDQHYHGTSAAIEFAVRSLRVSNIVVLGHALCGGVQALLDHGGANAGDFEFISHWMSIGAPARATVERLLPGVPEAVKRRALEQAVILTSLNNLMTFPWVRSGVVAGDITLHGWYFDMIKGGLLGYDFSKGKFREMKQEAKGFSKDLCIGDCGHEAWPLDPLVKNAGNG